MILEIVEITVRPGEEDAFAMAYRRAAHLVRDSPGCLSMRMTRGVEAPSRFVLLIEWESLMHHTEGFRESASFHAWRAEIGPFITQPPRVEHTVDL
ncbi:MAG: antibiotic biosynthesis monooxygenase family protein [Pseudonocardiales bacterium]